MMRTTITIDDRLLAELIEWPNSVLLMPAAGHWELFVRLIREAEIEGPVVSDAYLLALAIGHGCELATTHSDFARFEGVRWRHPLPA
ncbi:MAG: hypothetical protein AB1758_11315 [Candidatus Eremiobacterota bacterium]